jgi:hypothetical protein
MAFAIGCLAGCTSFGDQIGDAVFVKHPNSAQVKGERLTLNILSASPPSTQSTASAASAAFSQFALSQIEATLKAEAKRYRAGYSAETTKILDASHVLTGLHFKREINTHSNGGGSTAMEFCVDIFRISGTSNELMTFGAGAISLSNSKAKVVAFDLTSPFGFDVLNPWELVTDWFGNDKPRLINDNQVDLLVQVDLASLQKNKAGALVQVPMGSKVFSYQDETLGSGTPSNCKSPISAPNAVGISNVDDAFLAPEPFGGAGSGQRPIVIAKVSVTEVDEFGERVEEFSTLFDENRSGIEGQLNNLLNVE